MEEGVLWSDDSQTIEVISDFTRSYSLIKEEVKTLALTFYSFPSLPFPSLPFPFLPSAFLPFPSHSYVIDKRRGENFGTHFHSFPPLPFPSLRILMSHFVPPDDFL